MPLHRTNFQFGLENKSGEMKILSTLDFEEIKKYSAVLETRERGLVAQSMYC